MDTSRRCLLICTAACKLQCNTLHYTSAIIVFLVAVSSTSAGDCWTQRTSGFNTCKTLLRKNVTKDECCKYIGEGISWTETSYSDSDIFKLTNLQNGVPSCESCRGESGYDSCDQVNCGPDKKCVMKSGKPKCVCSPYCSRLDVNRRKVVCGTDGRTYRTKCVMLKEKCRTGDRETSMAYYGECQESCIGVQCPDIHRCIEDQDGKPHCLHCVDPCPQLLYDAFVCGDNGITYESLCELKRTACLQEITIEKQHYGECENLTTCDDLSCVESKTCVIHNDRPRCVICDFLCEGWRERGPLCASNGQTYNNWCDLQQFICNTTQYIEIEGYGICEEGDLLDIGLFDEGSGYSTDDNSALWRNIVSGGNELLLDHYEDDNDEDSAESYDNSTAPAENSTLPEDTTTSVTLSATDNTNNDNTEGNLGSDNGNSGKGNSKSGKGNGNSGKGHGNNGQNNGNIFN